MGRSRLSLQPPAHPRCCVDGNDAPDLEMAKQFQEAYSDRDNRVIHLDKTLAQVYKDAYEASSKSLLRSQHTKWMKFKRWFTSIPYPEEAAAHLYARRVLYQHLQSLHEKEDFTQCYRTLYTQPHGDKRTAMFTAFAISLFLGAEAVFATDSDTLLESNALQEMWVTLDSDPNYGAVTADVHIENWKDSFISLQSRLRYWMAFNIERACQSTFRCVTCISGPMALYRAYDLDSIIGMWLCQEFLGQHTTFGDDRHLTNCLLGKGLRTAYTHRTCCHSESPSTFVRWIRQQTRWSKSFYREALWFPRAFAYHHIWLGVETLKQGLYPFILLATILHILYGATPWMRLVTWAATMFGTAAFKGFLAFIISRDWRMLLFPGYPLLYFFGLLPSKLLALTTMGKTNWGTSARTASERKRGESLGQKSWHVGHLALFYLILITGLAHIIVYTTGVNWIWFVPMATIVPAVMLYWDELPFKRWIEACKDRITGRHKAKAANRVSLAMFSGTGFNPNEALLMPSHKAATTQAVPPNQHRFSQVGSAPNTAFHPAGTHPLTQPAMVAAGEQIGIKCKPLPNCERHGAVDPWPAGGASNNSPRLDYINTPPYPPPNAARDGKVGSTIDILDSGQPWPDLPPTVVGAKGAWVWQPASSAGYRGGDAGSPATPMSEVPPYPASEVADRSSPFTKSSGCHRADWSRQQASSDGCDPNMKYGGPSGNSTPGYEQRHDGLQGSHGWAPGSYVSFGGSTAYSSESDQQTFAESRRSSGSKLSPPYLKAARGRSSASSTGSTGYLLNNDHSSAQGGGDGLLHPYMHLSGGRQTPTNGLSRGHHHALPSPLSMSHSQLGSEATSPTGSPRTLSLLRSPTLSNVQLPCSGDVTNDHQHEAAFYADPFASSKEGLLMTSAHSGSVAHSGADGDTSHEGQPLFRKRQQHSDKSVFHPMADVRRPQRDSYIYHRGGEADPFYASRFSNTSAIDDYLAKRGARMTTYGGLINAYGGEEDD